MIIEQPEEPKEVLPEKEEVVQNINCTDECHKEESEEEDSDNFSLDEQIDENNLIDQDKACRDNVNEEFQEPEIPRIKNLRKRTKN